jgi:DNA-binding PadR family transcriptional regulator
MNTLSFGLLSLLTTNNYTGYDLMLKIQLLWHVNHSQIYPLLAYLENEGWVQFEQVVQSDKPNKKIYSITEKGLSELKEWMAEPTAEPVLRDEMLFKAYCINIVDSTVIQTLFAERKGMYNEYMKKYTQYYEDLNRKAAEANEKLDIDSPKFGIYIVLKKAIMVAETNLEWCRWVMEQTKKGPEGETQKEEG